MDYLTGSAKKSSKSSHKFGFSNPNDFEFAVKLIASIYKKYVYENKPGDELVSNFAYLSQDLQQSVIDVMITRRSEISDFLLREHNTIVKSLLFSFDWDVRCIIGSSSSTKMSTKVVSIILNCYTNCTSSTSLRKICFELKKNQLIKLLLLLEECNNYLL